MLLRLLAGALRLRLRGDAELGHEIRLVEVGALALDQTVAERRHDHGLETTGCSSPGSLPSGRKGSVCMVL